jgi:hypothetical protein
MSAQSIPQDVLQDIRLIAADLAANATVSVARGLDFVRIAGAVVDAEDGFRCQRCGGNECEHAEGAQAIINAIEGMQTIQATGRLTKVETKLLHRLICGAEDLFTLNTLHIQYKACQWVQRVAGVAA